MKYITIFVEGETEEELYTSFIIPNIRSKIPSGRFNDLYTSVYNVRGFGGFKKDALMKFKKDILEKNPDCEHLLFLCYDTDVFEVASKPPINWQQVEKQLISIGAQKVIHICAKKSIEDWILYDLTNICRWLRLPADTMPKGKNGYEKLKYLFKKANKVYVKGKKVQGFLARLDINIIIDSVKEEIKSLYSEFGVKI